MDFWARGAFHRVKKIAGGPKPKGRISGVGMDGIRRKRKKGAKPRHVAESKSNCVNYDLFCKAFGSCDGQECEYSS
jgi:hypothetical protein|tara:strand:+ start:1700 stop:1927 length:228 start_codon:yes stop_codon:yes gene_type:complete